MALFGIIFNLSFPSVLASIFSSTRLFFGSFAFAPFASSSYSQLHASFLCLNSSQNGVGASKTELHQLHIRQQKFPPKPPTANSSASQPALTEIRHLQSKRLQTYHLRSLVGWTWELRKPWRRPGGAGAGAAGGLELLFGSSRQSQLWPELEAGSPVGTAISPTLHLLEVANWTLLVLLSCLEDDRGAAAWRGFPSKVRAFPLSTFSLISLIALLPFPCRPSTRLIWTSFNQSESKTWQSRINWWKFCWTKVGADRLSSLPPDSCQRPIHSNPKIAIFLSLPNKSIETRWGGRTYLNIKECQPNYVITLTYFENFPVSRHYFATVLLLVHISSISQLCSTEAWQWVGWG